MVFPTASKWTQHNTNTHNNPATHTTAHSSRNCRNCYIVFSNSIELEQHKRAVHKCTRGTFSDRMPYMTCGLCSLPHGSQKMVLWHLAIDHNDTRSYYGRFLQSMRSPSMIGSIQESIAQDANFQLQSIQRPEHMAQDQNVTDQLEGVQKGDKTFQTRINRQSSQNLPRVFSGYHQDPQQNQRTVGQHFEDRSSGNTSNSQPIDAHQKNTQRENYQPEKAQSTQTTEPRPIHQPILKSGDMDRPLSPASHINGEHNAAQKSSPRISTLSGIATGDDSSPSMLYQDGAHNSIPTFGIRSKLVTRRFPSFGDAVPEYPPAKVQPSPSRPSTIPKYSTSTSVSDERSNGH